MMDRGCTYTGATVEVDGLLITANGPGAATQYGEAIVAALN
jgi:protease I